MAHDQKRTSEEEKDKQTGQMSDTSNSWQNRWDGDDDNISRGTVDDGTDTQ